ncbi:MAG: hypothetical protein RL654_441 [Pseudomonadota bacterium]|jgi:hypothetical protein
MHQLATPDYEAYFDFCSNLIQLKVYDSTYRDAFQRAISWEPGDPPLSPRDADFRALLKHEVTHFLDVSTTAWGRRYSFRKLQFLHLLSERDPAVSDARDVFALESGEIELHSSLVRAGNVSPAECETIKNQLIYTEAYGVCLLLHYFKSSRIEHIVPISVLSLLEANATASEFLSLLQCANSQDDVIDRRLSLVDIQRRFDNLLNDRARLEYAALLHVTRVHFPNIELHELLGLVSATARFALDLSDMEMAMLANDIEGSFLNRELGHALAMELRRGSQRQVIYFKTVLFLYGWLQHVDPGERDACSQMVLRSPGAAIRRMWKDCFGRKLGEDWAEGVAEAIAVNLEKEMCNYSILEDGRILSESRKHNASQLKSKSVGLLSFRDLLLLDGLFCDDEPLCFPNRIDIDPVDYYTDRIDVLVQFEREYKSMSHARFHLPPGAPVFQL